MWFWMRKIMCVLGIITCYKLCVAGQSTLGFTILILVGVVNFWAIDV